MARGASRIRTQVTAVLVMIGLSGSAVFALTEQPIAGQKITLKRSSSGKERLRAVLKDGALLFPPFGQPGDPSLDGLTVELIGAGGEHVDFYVPPGLGKPGWKRISGRSDRYVYSNPEASNSFNPFATIVIREGHGIKLTAKRIGLSLAGPQGSVGIRVTTGDLRNCALFGPTTITSDVAGRFSAKDAAASALTSCASLSMGGTCGNGVVDPFDACDGPGSCQTEFGTLDCRPPGVPGECTCCGGTCGDLVGCCGPGIRPAPAPGPCNESCISTSCEEPWSCNPGYECVDGGCCGDVGSFCANTLVPSSTIPCCEGKICGRLVSNFFGVCCVPDGGGCSEAGDCCSNSCGAGGTCDPSS